MSNTKTPISVWQLERDLSYTLADMRAEILEASYPEDLLHEICDGAIPIYLYQLAECLAEDSSLAYPDDNIFSNSGSDEVDVWKILQWTIYERLNAVAHKWLAEQQASEAAA